MQKYVGRIFCSNANI